jgi:hypothetical protein
MFGHPLSRRGPVRGRPTRFAGPVGLMLVAASLLLPAAPVTAAEPGDMVLEWNVNAINAIANANTATTPGLAQVPPLAPIHLAMVHGAIYDAVNAIDGTHQPYLDPIEAPPGASQAAAAATAAHHVLVGLVPATLPQVTASLDALYATSLGKIPDGQAETDGIAVGAAAAAAMLANRVGDGRANTTRTFPIGTEAGDWRPVPPVGNNVFSWVGDVRPFALKSSDQLRTEDDPPLTSAEYTAEFNEVKALGAQTGSSRTATQEALANFIVVNPFPIVNGAFRDLARGHGLSTSEQARLFAMTSLSSADALISCWNNKNVYLSWRPQTAIRLADTDGNPDTVADPSWSSLFPTPGYPDNPSGYNCFAASMMHAGKAFFGTDQVAFELKGPAATRSYDRFTDYVRDAIDGRILIGFHFRHADVNGAWIGKKAAQWVDKHEFAPIR